MYDNNKQYIIMKEGSILNITHNMFATPFHTKAPTAKYPFPFCYFLFQLASKVRKIGKKSFLIRLHNNYNEARYNMPLPIACGLRSHCPRIMITFLFR